MLAIRLQRIGRKNRPSYRVVVSEHKRDLYGKHNEILGNYDPMAQPKVINLKEDRIKYWISVGAQPSATVHNLLVSNNVIDEKKTRAWKPKKKPASPPDGKEKEDGKDAEAKKNNTSTAEAPEGAKEAKSEEKPTEESKADESKKDTKQESKTD
jgi:small subunit ribosomal protein S16